ncbi:MAG: DNA repair protein RecN [Clostridia bacterium]|nr:DNA repair protein RecN [Clostridia bacterium]
MLQSITIKNIALISDITISLAGGLNVITGETGAGKSLVIDSISLLLGDKADKTLISYDKDYAYVEAVFTTKSAAIQTLMSELGLEKEETIVISRKLFKEGKNECKVNGKNFSLSMLKRLTAPLMDLHGQFEHQSILNEQNQLLIVDGIAGKEHAVTKEKFASQFEEYKALKSELNSFTADDNERNRLIDLYDYQIEEIEEANFQVGEEESLKEYRQKVLHIEKIADSLNNASELANFGFSGTGGLVETITRLMSTISQVKQYSKEIEELYNRLDSAKIDIADIVDSIDEQKDNLEFNEQEAKQNEERLDLLNSFKKKYGASIEEINAYLEKIKAENTRLKNSTEYISELKSKIEKIKTELYSLGGELSKTRKQAAGVLEQKITKELSELAMKNTTFKIEFDNVDLDQCDSTGLDRVEYLFSANKGQPAKPLSKIISGGEMSRFMLAVKNITADIENIDTMIFDEIDTGVSGVVAEELAKKLLKIAKTRQVICVSHLSQVASYATAHYYINKVVENDKTQTKVKLLSEEERLKEIARLIGGTISQHSLEHARFMIGSAKSFLESL